VDDRIKDAIDGRKVDADRLLRHCEHQILSHQPGTPRYEEHADVEQPQDYRDQHGGKGTP
jgi:hypothetical protein